MVIALVGTETDPQGWSRQADALPPVPPCSRPTPRPRGTPSTCWELCEPGWHVELDPDRRRRGCRRLLRRAARPGRRRPRRRLAAARLRRPGRPHRPRAAGGEPHRRRAAHGRGSHLVDVRPARGDRARGPYPAARRPADRVGRRQWPVARLPDRGLPVRGLGIDRRGGRADRGRRDRARPVPSPPRRRADGRRHQPVDVDVVPDRPGARRRGVLQPQRPGQGPGWAPTATR